MGRQATAREALLRPRLEKAAVFVKRTHNLPSNIIKNCATINGQLRRGIVHLGAIAR
jgi:hypothetical protein